MASDSSRPSALLIEHDRDLCEIEEIILTEAGFQVETLPPDADPVDYAARSRPSVIVIHVAWRGNQALDTVDRLHRDPTTRDIPVVAIAMSEKRAAEAQAGPNVRESVLAPYDVAALEAAAVAALGNPPPEAALPRTGQPVPPAVARAADALIRDTREIVLAAVEKLRAVEPYQSRFSELTRGLVDELGDVLGAIAVGLRQGIPARDVFAVPQVQQSVTQHVRLRESQHLGVVAAVREYQVLRNQVDQFLQGLVDSSQFSASDASTVIRWTHEYFTELLRLIIAEYHPSTPPSREEPSGAAGNGPSGGSG